MSATRPSGARSGEHTQRGTKNRSRWYNRYRVPDVAEVVKRLRGATLLMRLDDPAAANHHLAIAPGDPDWDRVFGVRNRAESVNSWLKDFSRTRAPCVGRARQRLAVLCGLVLHNFKALLRYCRKRKLDVHKLQPAPPP